MHYVPNITAIGQRL